MVEEVIKQTREQAKQDIDEADEKLEKDLQAAQAEKKAKDRFYSDPASYRLPFPEVIKEDSEKEAKEIEMPSITELQKQKSNEINKAVTNSFQKEAKDAIKQANDLAQKMNKLTSESSSTESEPEQ